MLLRIIISLCDKRGFEALKDAVCIIADMGTVYDLGQGAEKENSDEILAKLQPRTVDGSIFSPV